WAASACCPTTSRSCTRCCSTGVRSRSVRSAAPKINTPGLISRAATLHAGRRSLRNQSWSVYSRRAGGAKSEDKLELRADHDLGRNVRSVRAPARDVAVPRRRDRVDAEADVRGELHVLAVEVVVAAHRDQPQVLLEPVLVDHEAAPLEAHVAL